MPVYEPNEHEIYSEQTKQIREGVEISEGSLYLTDRRFIYELKGKRGFLRAAAPVKMIDIYLDSITNITMAVPRFKLMTKKTLTVEFRTDKGVETATFLLDDPKKWDKSMRDWMSDSKRSREESSRKEKEEAYRREVELAKARSPKANIGNLYMGDKKKPVDSDANSDYIDADYTESDEKGMQVSKSEYPAEARKKCKNCGQSVDGNMKFCPNCGQAL